MKSMNIAKWIKFDDEAIDVLFTLKVEFLVAMVIAIEMAIGAAGYGDDFLRLVASILFELPLVIIACIFVAKGTETTFCRSFKILWLAICWFMIAFAGLIVFSVCLLIVIVCYGIGEFLLSERKEEGYTNPVFPKDNAVIFLLAMISFLYLALNVFGLVLLSSVVAFLFLLLLVAISMIKLQMDTHFFALHIVMAVAVIVAMLVYPVLVLPILIVVFLINVSLAIHGKIGDYDPKWLKFE